MVSDDKHLRKGYSWETTLRTLRNRKHLRPLERTLRDIDARIAELEKFKAEMTKPKRRGRPPKNKQEEGNEV
jgi:hypothetical protein